MQNTLVGIDRLWTFLLFTVVLCCSTIHAQDKPPLPIAQMHGTDFTGGANGRYGASHYGKTNVNYVYATPTGDLSKMQSKYMLKQIPEIQQFLHLTAADNDVGGKCRIKITLNGRALFEGKNSYPKGDWATQKLMIPTGTLKVGENSIEIENTEPSGGAGGPPWFMIAEAIIAGDQYTKPLRPIRLIRSPQANPRAIGLAKIKITPTRPVLLSGYAGRSHQLTLQVKQDLWARAIVIGSDADKPVVLIAVDNVGVPARIQQLVANEIKTKFGIPADHLTISSTHTHSGPMLSGALETLTLRELSAAEKEAIEGYTREFIMNLVAAAEAALKDRAPAFLHYGQGSISFAVNRRHGTVVDHAAPVLVVSGLDDQPRGIITNYACHCVSAGSGPDLNGDWATSAAMEIESLVPGTTAVVLVGCGGDQNPRLMSGFPASLHQGKELANEVRRVMTLGLPTLNSPLVTSTSEITLSFAAVPTANELKIQATKPGVTGYRARKHLAQLEQNKPLPETLAYPIRTWTFGKELAMVFLGGEVVVDYALALKQELDANRLWMTAYSNDVACYIPSDRILKEGGYEADDSMAWYGLPSPLAKGTEARILTEVKRQLGDLQNWSHQTAKTGGKRPLTPDESIALMSVHPGFRVELVAAEPLVVDPVAIDFGPDGKLWVAEMRDYPEGIPGVDGPGGVIKFLKDTDGDGRYDQAHTFLEGVAFPTGVTAWRNGVLICSAPDVIYAEDTDGDGRADIRQTVLSGFATHNYQARVNSLSLGLDNWIYGAAGIFGGTITAEGKPAVGANNRDFRFQPDTQRVEAVSGRTQQGRVRDDWGNWFGCSNSQLLISYPITDAYYSRNPRASIPNPIVEIVSDPKLFPNGKLVQFSQSGPSGVPTSVCGLGMYQDTLLGPEFANNAFLCEPVNQLVHRRVLEPHQSLFNARRATGEEQSEFLSSTDNFFRPVQARTGPDGALWIVDMYRYVIEHPRFISQDVKANLDTRAGSAHGRIYRVLPIDVAPRPVPNIRSLSNADVVRQLAASNETVRNLAHLELLWRAPKDASKALQELAKSNTLPQGRIHALAVLDGLQLLTPTLLVEIFSKEQHPGVQRQLIRLAEKYLNSNPELLVLLVRFVDSPDAQVRLQLAYSLGESKSPAIAATLVSLLRQAGPDAYLRSAALSSVTPRNVGSVILEAAKFPQDHELIDAVILLAAEIAEPQALQAALQRELSPSASGYTVSQLHLLSSVHQAFTRRKIQLSDADFALWQNAIDRSRELSVDAKSAVELRAAAVELLPLLKDREQRLQSLVDCLQPQQPLLIQQSAIKALVSIKDDAATSALFAALRGLVPKAQSAALDEILSRQALTLELLGRLETDGLPRSMIDSNRKQQLSASTNSEIRMRAEALFAKPSSAEVSAQLASILALDLQRGKEDLGKEAFVKRCATCHRSRGVGHEVGPDLDSLTDRSKDYFVTSILDPNAAVDRRYATYTALMLDGRSFTGIIASETETSITLKEKDDVKRDLSRVDLDELSDTGKSMMPEGLGREISVDEMRNLMAFLKAVRLEPRMAKFNKPVAADVACVKGMAGLMADVRIGTADEYRQIPQVFGLAIAAGRRNQTDEIWAILDFALPREGEPLRDWEAVVIGGGVVNGISQSGVWPAARINEILNGDKGLTERWARLLRQSVIMADSETVNVGTRYDALRIVAMLPFEDCRAAISKYLQPKVAPDLVQGAVSGLADVPHEGAAVLLAQSFDQIPTGMREFALNGMCRANGDTVYLLDAVKNGKISAAKLPAVVAEKLLKHENASVRRSAENLLRKPEK